MGRVLIALMALCALAFAHIQVAPYNGFASPIDRFTVAVLNVRCRRQVRNVDPRRVYPRGVPRCFNVRAHHLLSQIHSLSSDDRSRSLTRMASTSLQGRRLSILCVLPSRQGEALTLTSYKSSRTLSRSAQRRPSASSSCGPNSVAACLGARAQTPSSQSRGQLPVHLGPSPYS